MAWTTLVHPEAQAELDDLPKNEAHAILNAIIKLQELGPELPYPHSSQVRNATDLRELRPRRGDSPWRAFYRRVGDTLRRDRDRPRSRRQTQGVHASA